MRFARLSAPWVLGANFLLGSRGGIVTCCQGGLRWGREGRRPRRGKDVGRIRKPAIACYPKMMFRLVPVVVFSRKERRQRESVQKPWGEGEYGRRRQRRDGGLDANGGGGWLSGNSLARAQSQIL